MSNLCTVVRPPSLSQDGWDSTLFHWNQSAFGASSVPFLFDADTVGISCVAFANNASAGTLLSYQTQINSLQTALASTQVQLNQLITVSGGVEGQIVTSEDAGYVFAWGFAAVIGLWAIGYAAGAFVNLIRKL